MAGSAMESGQSRVRSKEMNNRTGGKPRAAGTKTPRKSGAKSGFASNKMKGGGIFRSLKGGNTSLGG